MSVRHSSDRVKRHNRFKVATKTGVVGLSFAVLSCAICVGECMSVRVVKQRIERVIVEMLSSEHISMG